MRTRWLLVLAACGGSDALHPDAAIDAPAPVIDASADTAVDSGDALDLACNGQPVTPARGPVMIAGKVFGVVRYAVAPEAGAHVELRHTDDTLAGEATTAADGAFSIPAPAPVTGYFAVTAAGKLPTRAVADTPLAGGDDALLIVADVAELTRWYGDAGATYATGARTLVTVTRDCQGHTLDGSTLATSVPVAYYDDQAGRWDPALAASTNGVALIPNAPASVTVAPQLGTTTLPAETLAPRPDELELAVISPFD